MSEYAIVAIGYNRPDSMQRLLKALSMVNYGADEVTLYISIDNSGDNFVEKVANDFWDIWEKGNKDFSKTPGIKNAKTSVWKNC